MDKLIDESGLPDLKPGKDGNEEAGCEVAKEDDSHLAVQVISQAFLKGVGNQRNDQEYDAEKIIFCDFNWLTFQQNAIRSKTDCWCTSD